MKTWLSYEEEIQKADSPGKIQCKCRAAFRADSPELCDRWGAQREVRGFLKRRPHRFRFPAKHARDPMVFLASPHRVPASSCLCETGRSDVPPARGTGGFPKAQARGY